MTEIIKYAEELIRLNGWDRGHIVSRLVAELKAARASEGGSEPPTEDENGFVEWEYPHGAVQVFDGGVIGWGRWHFEDATKLRDGLRAFGRSQRSRGRR